MSLADDAYAKLTTDEILALRVDIQNELADDLLALQAAYDGDDAGLLAITEDHPLWNLGAEYLAIFEAWLRVEAQQDQERLDAGRG